MSQQTTLEITKDGVKLTHPGPNNSSVTKLIELEDLSRALAKTAKIETGLLPRGCRLFSKNGNKITVAMEVPEFIGRINLTQGRFYTVPVPHTLFVYSLVESQGGYRMSRSSCYSMKGPLISEDTNLYIFPFGNVSTGGGVCWGSLKLPIVPRLNSMITYVEIFFGSVFNGDMSYGVIEPFTYEPEDKSIASKVKVENGLQFLAYLNGKKEFPYDKLKSCTTFKQALRGI